LFEVILKIVKPDHSIIFSKTEIRSLVDELLDLTVSIVILVMVV
jgi:hypothetical protein